MIAEEKHSAWEGTGEGRDAAEDFREGEGAVWGCEDDVCVEDSFEAAALHRKCQTSLPITQGGGEEMTG